MALALPPGEPAAARWRTASTDEFVRLVLTAAGDPLGRPRVVAVDGRSGSGKSTLAARLSAAVPASVVVPTDDVAWHEPFFGWAPLLALGVLEPVRRGEAVCYRPPAWDNRGRAGAIDVRSGLDLVVVEGVGSGQRAFAALLDTVVWVQSDFAAAERRGIERDVAHGGNGDVAESTAFWHEWMAEELPFLARERPWERACVVVCGSPPGPVGEDEIVLAPGPL